MVSRNRLFADQRDDVGDVDTLNLVGRGDDVRRFVVLIDLKAKGRQDDGNAGDIQLDLLLLIGDASKAPELFAKSARVYTRYVAAEVEKHYDFVMSATSEDLADYRK